MHCVFCNHDLGGADSRAAFDPWLGRLWRVCGSCRRWNVVPLEDRWETLEEYERDARDGKSRLRTEHLDLVQSTSGQLIRVGRAPRPELAGWRYSDVLPQVAIRGGLLAWLRRLFLGMPSAPLGYDAGYGALMSDQQLNRRWFASPFLEHAPTLTAAFLHVPLADACPACYEPLAIAPWSFQALRLTRDGGRPATVATCGLCGTESAQPVERARAGLRLGLSVVNRPLRDRSLVEQAASALDRTEGPEGWLHALAAEDATLGELDTAERLALGIALDEQGEAELLEEEWREAEELAQIVDRELTEVEGFERFRRGVLGGES